MTFRIALLIELLGGALVIALLLLSQRAHAQPVWAPCYPSGPGEITCDSRTRVYAGPTAIEAPTEWPSHTRNHVFSEDSASAWYDRKPWPYSDDYPGYAPLDPAVHDQLDRIEGKLDELER